MRVLAELDINQVSRTIIKSFNSNADSSSLPCPTEPFLPNAHNSSSTKTSSRIPYIREDVHAYAVADHAKRGRMRNLGERYCNSRVRGWDFCYDVSGR